MGIQYRYQEIGKAIVIMTIRLKKLIIVLSWGIPFFMVVRNILIGNIPFWFDNARDMLLALDNLQKPTLIGTATGMPGIFYGPYWIWLLSIGAFISKNPRVVDFVAGVIPYFVVFPYILFKFSKLFGTHTMVLVWLVFIFSMGADYASSMWNPHLTTLLFLILAYLLVFKTSQKLTNYKNILLIGIILGLIINFHMSLGVGLLLGVVLYFFLGKSLNKIKTAFFLGFGTALTFVPFFIFEIRHGFNQIQSAFYAFTKYGGIINLEGLTKAQILHNLFYNIPAELFLIKNIGIYFIELSAIVYFLVIWKTNRLKLKTEEKRLIKFLIISCFGILFIFLTAKNPIWSYHFIGTEIFFLFITALLVSRSFFFKYLLTGWVLFVMLSSVSSLIKNFNGNPYGGPSLITKEYIVDIVGKDAGHSSYTVFNYSPSIYQYDYAYLFKWKYNKDVPWDPGKNPIGKNTTYLIIPSVSEIDKGNYINFYSPSDAYKTSNLWKIPDGSEIYKRVKTN